MEREQAILALFKVLMVHQTSILTILNPLPLRGALAAALYGSQAGNGVIVITTKKGTKNRASVTLNLGVASEYRYWSATGSETIWSG